VTVPLLERARSVTVRSRPWLLPLAFAAFAVTAVLAFRALPSGLDVEPWLLVVSAVLVCPLSTAANAAEFVATARVVGVRVGPGEALRVAVMSSAANLLPLPGAVAVRTHHLRAAAGTRRALGVTAAAGICWLGTALLAAGAADAVANRRPAAAVPVGAGAVAVVVAAVMVRRAAGTDPARRRAWWWVWSSEVGQVVVGTARLALAVSALGHAVDLPQSLGLAVAPVAGSAVGVLPGGLGVREAIAASIAALVDLPAAVGGAAAAVDRLVGLVVVGALVPVARRRRPPEPGTAAS
jgi:uncharacterized membrane protein YbhN (UPF0104 family)